MREYRAVAPRKPTIRTPQYDIDSDEDDVDID
jgi:hypothetical protein